MRWIILAAVTAVACSGGNPGEPQSDPVTVQDGGRDSGPGSPDGAAVDSEPNPRTLDSSPETDSGEKDAEHDAVIADTGYDAQRQDSQFRADGGEEDAKTDRLLPIDAGGDVDAGPAPVDSSTAETGTQCECTDGPCCDGCMFRERSYPCILAKEEWNNYDEPIPVRPYVSSCDDGDEYRNVFCTGTSSTCDDSNPTSEVLVWKGPRVCSIDGDADDLHFGDTCFDVASGFSVPSQWADCECTGCVDTDGTCRSPEWLEEYAEEYPEHDCR